MMQEVRLASGAGRRRRLGATRTRDMLAFTIGWQEILLIVLFVLGVVVIPLPGRWMRRAAHKPLRWSNEFLAAPIPTIHDVAEAFFCSYARGEYALEGKERFRLVFRRGPAPREDDGQVVLSLRGDPTSDDLPVILRVLFQPRADGLLITMRHEVHAGKSLAGTTRRKLSATFRREAKDFRAYLRENFGGPESIVDAQVRPAKRITATRKGDR